MKSVTKLMGIIAIAAVIVFSMAAVGCDNGNNDSGGGGETGTVRLTNSTGTDLRKLKITNGGKQVKYDEVVSRNANYPNIPRGLCTISFDLGLNGKNYSHSFTVSPGETVSINFTERYNFVITRSGGENTAAATGSIRVVNTYTTGIENENKLVRVSIQGGSYGGPNVSDYINQITPIMNRNSSKTYPDIKPGTYDVVATRLVAQGYMLVNRNHREEGVVVKAGETTTVNISYANYLGD